MASGNEVDYKTATSIYDFTVKDTYGQDVSLEKYRGYVVLIVNIASQCGLTKSNYEKLTKLHDEYYDKGKRFSANTIFLDFWNCFMIFFFTGLRILGFPCNQFAGQMPENDGDEMICHLQKEKAEFGDIFAKVS